MEEYLTSLKKEYTFIVFYIIDNPKADYQKIMEEYLLGYLKSISVKEQEISDNFKLLD